MFLWGGGNPAPSRCAPWGYTEIMHLKIKTLKPSKHRQTAGYNRSFALLLNGCDRKLDASVHFCWKTTRHALTLQSSLGGVILPVSLSKSFPMPSKSSGRRSRCPQHSRLPSRFPVPPSRHFEHRLPFTSDGPWEVHFFCRGDSIPLHSDFYRYLNCY